MFGNRERERGSLWVKYIRSHKAHFFGAAKAMDYNDSVTGFVLGHSSFSVSQAPAITKPNPRRSDNRLVVHHKRRHRVRLYFLIQRRLCDLITTSEATHHQNKNAPENHSLKAKNGIKIQANGVCRYQSLVQMTEQRCPTYQTQAIQRIILGRVAGRWQNDREA